MSEILAKRYQEPRNDSTVSLLRYLHNPECLNEDEDNEIFYMPSRYMLEKETKRLMSRLFQIDHSKEMSASAIEEEKQSSSEVISFSSQLSNALTNASVVKSKHREEKMKKLSKVFGSFEATHERTADLERLYQALLTIASTSVSSEHAFSIAGNYLTSRRVRLNVNTCERVL